MGCKKHRLGRYHSKFDYKGHTYLAAKCEDCKNMIYTKDDKEISKDEFMAINELAKEEYMKHHQY
jgi:hypothetical protein